MKSIYQEIEYCRTHGIPAVLCTITATAGSTPLKEGSKMLVTSQGIISGTIGGGNIEYIVTQKSEQILITGKSEEESFNLVKQLGMCCGGTVRVFMEYIEPVPQLYIFGAGHVGSALASLAHDSGFMVILADNRENMLEKAATKLNKLYLDDPSDIDKLQWNSYTYIAILTYDHALDREILARCIRKPHRYLGMIGSKRKIAFTRSMFLNTGRFTTTELDSIDMPMGYNISAISPQEIAISIIAKLIYIKNTEAGTSRQLKEITYGNA